MSEITLTKENFEAEVMQSDKPVLIDFWATWCGPCKMLAPIIKEIADEYEGKIKVGKVDVDKEPQLAIKYGIVSIPTLFLIKDGKVAASTMGYMTKDQVKASLGI